MQSNELSSDKQNKQNLKSEQFPANLDINTLVNVAIPGVWPQIEWKNKPCKRNDYDRAIDIEVFIAERDGATHNFTMSI